MSILIVLCLCVFYYLLLVSLFRCASVVCTILLCADLGRTASFLQEDLSLGFDLAATAKADPQILMTSKETITDNIHALKELGFTEEQVGQGTLFVLPSS